MLLISLLSKRDIFAQKLPTHAAICRRYIYIYIHIYTHIYIYLQYICRKLYWENVYNGCTRGSRLPSPHPLPPHLEPLVNTNITNPPRDVRGGFQGDTQSVPHDAERGTETPRKADRHIVVGIAVRSVNLLIV